ncbi:MAG: hypothetical protein D6714_02395, partial [Bacteroidetes bacterium]
EGVPQGEGPVAFSGAGFEQCNTTFTIPRLPELLVFWAKRTHENPENGHRRRCRPEAKPDTFFPHKTKIHTTRAALRMPIVAREIN